MGSCNLAFGRCCRGADVASQRLHRSYRATARAETAIAALKQGPAQLASLSRFMAWLTLGAALVAPPALLLVYLAPDIAAPLDLHLTHLGGGHALSAAIPVADRLRAVACAVVPLAVAVWGLLALRRLFVLFAAGEIFAAPTRHVGSDAGGRQKRVLCMSALYERFCMNAIA